MAAEGSGEIEGVNDEELAAVAGLVPELPNVGAAKADRFAQAVRTLVEKRAQAGWPNEGAADLAVFVLVDHPRKVGETHSGTPFVDPMAQGIPLLGYMFFCSPDASHGQLIPMPVKDNEFLEWLEDQQLGACPVVAVYRTSQQMATRRYGVNDHAWNDAIRDKEPLATIEELMAALSHFHERQVLTPMGCPDGVWKPGHAHKYVPGEHPEKSIQSHLEIALNFWFRGVVKAESEDSTTIGRIDLRLLTKGADGRLAYWVILELKVIKSFTNSGSNVSDSSNVDAIVKGIKQAGSYRENRNSDEGMLEIYDLRKDKSEDLMVRESVSAALTMYSPSPRVDVWPMYGTTDHARNAGYSGS